MKGGKFEEKEGNHVEKKILKKNEENFKRKVWGKSGESWKKDKNIEQKLGKNENENNRGKFAYENLWKRKIMEKREKYWTKTEEKNVGKKLYREEKHVVTIQESNPGQE